MNLFLGRFFVDKSENILCNLQTSFDLSLLAVGSTIELVDALMHSRCQNGMAIIRPPGHHAMKAEYNGYCFFNNVAIAAQHALDNCGAQRILIVDWDVHHGQGTQRMFYDDPRVLYFSVHRYEHGMFWPNLRESDYDYVGDGAGAGFNFNVPLNQTGMTNADYLAIWQQLLMPVAIEVYLVTHLVLFVARGQLDEGPYLGKMQPKKIELP